MSVTDVRKLFEEFQKIWTLEKVKNMTLEEYTSVKGDGKRDDFTYWIENQLDILGSVWGGSAFKFGIYKRDRIEDKEQGKGRVYDKHYAWLEKYGKTQQEAFKKVKSLIMQVIECSQKNELAKIDKIDLGHAYKWKIAFHYQNPDNMKMFCIFKQDTLRRIADKELNNSNLPTSQIYTQLMSDKKYTLETSMQERLKPLWKKYGNENDKDDENEGDTMPNTPTTKNPPLNQILYGPPGTGKTYSTIDRALEILGVETQDKSRAELKAKFDEFRQNGQIEFVTFHQSFSYEEFVEGIKPNIENENTEMTYEVKDGIFKDISDRALSNYQAHKDSLQNLPHKESNTKELFQAFAQNLQEQLTDAENGIDFNTPSLSTKMQISKVFYFKNEEAKSIAISVPNSKSNQVLKRDLVLRDYEKFKSGEIQSYKDIKPTYESLAQWHGNAIYYFALYEKIAEFEKSYKPQNQAVSEVKLKPYILIIDEINRGNISKILGELITLIEPSKRIGADEELRVSLPYSTNEFDGGNGFGVPSNLYIIGTMNTADRSIALLDTALRRRFEFVEMISQPELLKNIWIVKDTEQRDNENLVIPKNRMEELDEYMSEKSNCLYQILNSINNRIEFLLDREHTIGHAFFFEKAKFYKNDKLEWYELTLESLKEIFVKKIIPLLQEYFYDDYAKIDAVLNGNGMIEPKKDSTLEKLFDTNFKSDLDSEKVVYQITNSNKWNEKNFLRIYDSSVQIDKDE